jgi:hypothetical protein
MKGMKVGDESIILGTPYITATRSKLPSHHVREGALYFGKRCLRDIDVNELLYCPLQGPS